VVEIFETVPGHGLAIAGGCLIDLYATLPDSRHLDVVEAVLSRREAPLSHLIVLSGQGLRPPSSLFRQRAVSISERERDRIRCRANKQ
jgi:hypothetical protein